MQIIKMHAKYDGICQFCSEQFLLGDTIYYVPELKSAFHSECPIIKLPIIVQTSRKNIASIDVQTLDVQSHVLPELIELFDGRFSVPFLSHDGEKKHCVVELKTLTYGKYPGSRRIRVHLGRHAGKEFLRAGYITKEGVLKFYKDFMQESNLTEENKKIAVKAIKLVVSGKENAAYALEYAKIARCCWRCGKSLYHPKTLENLEVKYGCGPICYKYVEERKDLLQKITTSTPAKVMVLD